MSCLGRCSGVSFGDATSLSVCHNRRIAQHKTFHDQAKLEKPVGAGFTVSSCTYSLMTRANFSGCCSPQGTSMTRTGPEGRPYRVPFCPRQCCFVQDRKALVEMLEHPECTVFGKIFADRGYISQPLFEKLLREKGIALITGFKKNKHTSKPMLAEADRPDRRAGPIGGPPREVAQLGQDSVVLLKRSSVLVRAGPEGAALPKTGAVLTKKTVPLCPRQ